MINKRPDIDTREPEPETGFRNRYRNTYRNIKQAEVKYGEYWLREIGIDIACYDEQNADLPYPIKITHDANAVYEDCEPSPADPCQGWGE